MLSLEKVADLEMSAASALVADGPLVLVVADDETYLDAYSTSTGKRAWRVALLARVLPNEPVARKASKPDFEALTRLPDGRLLVLGSGSAAQRDTGVILLGPNAVDGPPREPREVDLGPLYGTLRKRLPHLNIEGASVAGDALLLFSRGGADRENAVVELDAAATVAALDTGSCLPANLVRSVRSVDLGHLDGVALGFTDAAPLPASDERRAGPWRVLFAAAAEDTANAYDDGPCAGSVVGVLDASGRILFRERVEGRQKVEGIDLTAGGLFLVADPDDRAQRAPLFRATVDPGWFG